MELSSGLASAGGRHRRRPEQLPARRRPVVTPTPGRSAAFCYVQLEGPSIYSSHNRHRLRGYTPPIILVASRERAAQPQPGRAASEGRAYGIGVARTDTIFVKSRLNALGAKPSGNHSVDRLLLHLGGCQHVRLQPERCCAALECHVARVDAIHG